MNFLKIAIAALLLQAPGTTPDRTPAAPASIEGIVTGPSGEPLSKVTVTVSGAPESLSSQATGRGGIVIVSSPNQAQTLGVPIPQEFTITTGRDGKFSFENLKPGSYFLGAQHAGYVSNEYGQRGPNGLGTPLALTAGQKLKGIQLALTPQGAITGRVTDRNGQPVSGAMVQAIQFNYMDRGRALTVAQAVTSNDMGEYRLYWLNAGNYVVCVSPGDNAPTMDPAIMGLAGNSPANLAILRGLISSGRGFGTYVTSRTQSDGSSVEESAVPVFFPGVYRAEEAAAVTVRAGLTTGGVNVVAIPSRTQRIRGITVNGATGRPESLQLSLTPRNSKVLVGLSTTMRSDDNGTFEISGVVAGSYYLIADGGGRAIVPVDIANTDLNNIVLTTNPGITISGRLTMEDNGAASVTGPNAQIRLVSTDPAAPSGLALLDGTNRFQIAGMYPGDYFVTLLGNADRYLKSVRMGGQDGLGDPIHIDESTRDLLDIVMSRSSGRIEGHVLNEKREPVQSATVVVIPDPPLRQRTSLYYTPHLDSSGKFQIDAAPGRYRVFAWEDIEPNAWFDADFLRPFEGRGRPVIVGDNGRESVEVTVIPYVP